MEDLPLGRIAALVPEFAVKDLPLGRTLMIIIMETQNILLLNIFNFFKCNFTTVNYLINMDFIINLSLMRNLTLFTTLN